MKLPALSLIVLSLSAVTLSASTSNLLNSQDLAANAAKQQSADTSSSYGHRTGVVSSVPMLDSRAWVIYTPDGRCYDPTNLPDSMKVEGMKINFSYKAAADWGYIYACGELIELTQCARVK
jgi:hypothetical protein